jgi:WD40 repeat protein
MNKLVVNFASICLCLNQVLGQTSKIISSFIPCRIFIRKFLFHLFQVITASNDLKIKVWNYETGNIVRTIDAHRLKINALIKLANESVATCSDDRTVTVWNPFNGILIKNFTKHSDAVTHLIQMTNGFLASVSADKNIKIWDPFGNSEIDISDAHSDSITSIICLNDGRLASGSRDSSIKIWDSSSGQMIKELPIYSRRVLHLAQVSLENIVAAYDDKFIKIWDKTSNTEVFSVEKDDDMSYIKSVYNQHFAYSCKNLIEVRNSSGSLIGSLTHPKNVNSFQFLSSNTIISGSTNIYTWNFVDNIKSDINQPVTVSFTDILPNDYLAVGYDNGTLLIWDIASATIKATSNGHTDRIIGIVSSTGFCFTYENY